MIDEIDYAAEVSGIDKVTVNGKVYLAADKVLEIIDDTRSGILDTHYTPTMKWAFERIKGAVSTLKGGEQGWAG